MRGQLKQIIFSILRESDIITYVVNALVFIGIFITDFFILPKHELVGILYAIPVMIAAQRLPARMVAWTAVVSLAFYIYSELAKAVPITIWMYGIVGQIIIIYLAILVAREMKAVSTRAAEAEEARLRLRDFMSMVAHDLRGPLTVIMGYAQLLAKEGDNLSPETRERALHSVEADARQMNRLIEDLLDTSRIESHHFEIQPQQMDLVALARRIIAEQQMTTKEHHLVLVAPESLEGKWDRDRLAQVFTNLISNAIKYSPSGGEVRTVIKPEDNRVTVTVTDQGVGFEPEEINLLFQPFSRVYRERTIKGTGLGLYITKGVVEAHGGHIWVESPGRNKGSTFTFVLPRSLGSDDEPR